MITDADSTLGVEASQENFSRNAKELKKLRAIYKGAIAFRTSVAEVRPGDEAVIVIGPACLLDFIINRHLPCHALRCGC